MYIARRDGTEPWLIPDQYRQQYEAMGFRRFDEPPSGTAEINNPVPFVEAVPSAERIQLSRPSVVVVEPIPTAATLGGDKSRTPKRKRV